MGERALFLKERLWNGLLTLGYLAGFGLVAWRTVGVMALAFAALLAGLRDARRFENEAVVLVHLLMAAAIAAFIDRTAGFILFALGAAVAGVILRRLSRARRSS
jgi:hypothetical protein